MSQARQLADVASGNTTERILSGRKNLIINGAMQVAQRGTSFTSGGYSLDHWYIAEAGTCTVIQDTADVPANFKYAMKTTTSAASSFIAIYHPFEAVDYEAFKNKTVTISFYAKVNATFSGDMFVDLQTGDTADTLLSGNWAGNDLQSITPTTSWAKYTVTIAVGSTNGVRFVLAPSSAQASGAEYSITGVQLELGSQATDFEYRSYGEELALCQRYYYKIQNHKNDVSPFNNEDTGAKGTTIAGAAYRMAASHPVEMRAAPSITFNSVYIWDGSGEVSVSSISHNNSTKYIRSLDYNLSASVGNNNMGNEFVRDSNGYIAADAELY